MSRHVNSAEVTAASSSPMSALARLTLKVQEIDFKIICPPLWHPSNRPRLGCKKLTALLQETGLLQIQLLHRSRTKLLHNIYTYAINIYFFV